MRGEGERWGLSVFRSVNFPQIYADFSADLRRFCGDLRGKSTLGFKYGVYIHAKRLCVAMECIYGEIAGVYIYE